MWDVPVITRDEKEKTCLLIDTAISDDSNFNTKQTEKVSERAGDRVQQDLKSQDKTVPVINAALGANKNKLDQNLQLVLGHPLATELQKITIMSSAHSIHTELGGIALTSR